MNVMLLVRAELFPRLNHSWLDTGYNEKNEVMYNVLKHRIHLQREQFTASTGY
jgi:hypothetical protein